MKKAKILTVTAALLAALTLSACANSNHTPEGGEITTMPVESVKELTTEETASVTENTALPEVPTIIDREGNEIPIPDEINSIVSAAPSITEILSGLGLADKIIAADVYSADVPEVDPSVCTLDFYNLNAEELIMLDPDVVIINGISDYSGNDPYQSLKDAGINVIYIPTSNSISAVKLDIEFLADYTGTDENGAELISSIEEAEEYFSAKAETITERKTVYFEIGAAPYLYTCGHGTFIDEIITLIGAENIYSEEEGYLSNSDETVIAGNPDVIITNVMYDGYDFNEIKSREGWDSITAVKNGAVYSVDSNATSRPSQNIVKGIYEVAEAVYPEVYGE